MIFDCYVSSPEGTDSQITDHLIHYGQDFWFISETTSPSVKSWPSLLRSVYVLFIAEMISTPAKHMYIYSSVTSVFLSVHPSIHPSIHPGLKFFFFVAKNRSHPSIHGSMICPSIYSIRLSIFQSVLLYVLIQEEWLEKSNPPHFLCEIWYW